MPPMSYADFLLAKAQDGNSYGFAPASLPDFLFDFQRSLAEWALVKGRAAIFADCGLGKTPMQLVWADQIVRKTNRPVLILTPLAVGAQTVREGAKFNIECARALDGKREPRGIVVTNYERLHHFKPADFVGVVCDEYASAFWDDVRIGHVLPFKAARDPEDEKHVHPLQLDVIERCVTLWSNEGETIFTPFMGVGSEVYGAVKCGRRGIGIELKPSYFTQAARNLAAAGAFRDDTEQGDLKFAGGPEPGAAVE